MITHNADHGGANTSVASLLRHRPESVEAEWVFLRDGPAVEQSPVPAHVISVGRAREAWRWSGAIVALRSEARRQRADLVFANVTKAQLYASLSARLAGIPSIWWQRERYGQRPLMHQAAGRLPAAAVICSAEHSAAEQRKRFPRTPVVMIHPGIETGALGPPREHVEAAAVRIGIVGRLQRWKRVELAIDAMAAVRTELPQARLVVMGAAEPGLDEDYPAHLRDVARGAGIAEAVDFVGHVPDAADAMAGLDLLVHCAEVEPFGLVPLEAMARGVPVVVPDEGGPRETVRDGIDGVRVDPTDTAALAAAIVALGRDPALRTAMGATARTRVLEAFTAQRTAQRTWEVAQAVAAGRPPG